MYRTILITRILIIVAGSLCRECASYIMLSVSKKFGDLAPGAAYDCTFADNSNKSCQRIVDEIFGGVGCLSNNKSLHFGADPGRYPDPGILTEFLQCGIGATIRILSPPARYGPNLGSLQQSHDF